jgi:hypothetical protein
VQTVASHDGSEKTAVCQISPAHNDIRPASTWWEYEMIGGDGNDATTRDRTEIDPIAVVEIDDAGRGGGDDGAVFRSATTGRHRRGQSCAGARRLGVPTSSARSGKGRL